MDHGKSLLPAGPALCLLILILSLRPALAAETGLVKVDCWFEPTEEMPATDCYRMHVPENHARPGDKSISFPLVVFRARFNLLGNAPVLHLGGGGPGAPMYLDDDLSMRYFWEYHDEISTAQQRDLIVIDPRGTGLAEPLLACQTFVDNEVDRLRRNMSMLEEWQDIDRDYHECIDDYARQGVDFSAYNSYSVALDIEMLRQAMQIESWSLIGVSYGSIYAQMLAREFPHSVESMVLDSATFPHIEQAENWMRLRTEPFHAMLNYCSINPSCEEPLPDFATRFWNLYRGLNLEPLDLDMDHPYRDGRIRIVLNGERLLGVLLQGTYGTQLFNDLPAILTELERRRSRRLQPYLESTLLYVFDRNWGDISSEAHYCFDIKPWTNFEWIKSEASKLPDGYLKTSIELSLSMEGYCERMGIDSGYPAMAEAVKIEIPTLFLHGKFDSVTFLDDIVAQQQFFPHSYLIKFDQAHSMISNEECAEIIAARFVRNPDIAAEKLDCN